VITKLLAKKKCTIFVIYILGDDSLYIFGRWWGVDSGQYQAYLIQVKTYSMSMVKLDEAYLLSRWSDDIS
jgi:hypothetical protein